MPHPRSQKKNGRENPKLQAASGSIIGGRDEQQDACAVIQYDDGDSRSNELLLLADGMGGHVGGRMAADLAIANFQNHFLSNEHVPIKQRLHEALMSANASLKSKIGESPELKGMGCTFVAATFTQGRVLHWVSVGDSHLFQISQDNITKLNADHSMAPQIDQQAADGEITEDAAANHPDRNALISALTGDRIAIIDQASSEIPENCQIMLSSDGIDTLTRSELVIEFAKSSSPSSSIGNLLRAVESRMLPDQDNTTIVLTNSVVAAKNNRSSMFGNVTLLLLVILGTVIVASAITWAVIDSRGRTEVIEGQPVPAALPEPTVQPGADEIGTMPKEGVSNRVPTLPDVAAANDLLDDKAHGAPKTKHTPRVERKRSTPKAPASEVKRQAKKTEVQDVVPASPKPDLEVNPGDAESPTPKPSVTPVGPPK